MTFDLEGSLRSLLEGLPILVVFTAIVVFAYKSITGFLRGLLRGLRN